MGLPGYSFFAVTVILLSLLIYKNGLGQTSKHQLIVDKQQSFEEVSQLIETHFFDESLIKLKWKGITKKYHQLLQKKESPEESYAVINEALSLLNASHTHLYTKYNTEYYELLDIFKNFDAIEKQVKHFFPNGISYTGIGILTRKIAGSYYIIGVLESSPAFKAGFKRGYKVLTVNRKPFHPIKSFVNLQNKITSVKVTNGPLRDKILDLQVKPEQIYPNKLYAEAMKESIKIISRNNVKIGYVHIWSYAGKRFHEILKNEVAFGKLKSADSLLIDLRDGWGGANPDYLNLFNKNVPVLSHIKRDGTRIDVDFQWRKKVSLLINERTRSGKEVLAYAFKKYRIGKVIGSRSAGAVLGGTPFMLKDGSLLIVAGRGAQVDGKIIEGEGVQPDIEILDPIEQSQSDVQLEKALDILANDNA